MSLSSANNKINDEKLATIVRRFKWLYDNKHPKFYKLNYKEKTWSDVALKLDHTGAVSGEYCKKRWKQLRESYRKHTIYRSHRKTATASPWRLHKSMSFLLPFFKKPDEMEMESESNEDSQHDDNSDFIIERNKSESITLPVSPENMVAQNNWFINEMPSNSTNFHTNVNGLTNHSPIQSPTQMYPNSTNNSRMEISIRDNTHLSSFFGLIQETVQTFSLVQQIEVKRKINEIVNEIELQNAIGSSIS